MLRYTARGLADFEGAHQLELAIRRLDVEILGGLSVEDAFIAKGTRPNFIISFEALVRLLVIGAKIQLTHIDTPSTKTLLDGNSAAEQRLRHARDSVDVVTVMMTALQALEDQNVPGGGKQTVSDCMCIMIGVRDFLRCFNSS